MENNQNRNTPSLRVILLCSFFLPEIVASCGFDTMLINAIPSSPTIFSKSTYPRSFLLTFSMDIPKYVPLEFNLRIGPQKSPGLSDMDMCRKRDLVLDSRIANACQKAMLTGKERNQQEITHVCPGVYARWELAVGEVLSIERNLQLQ